MERISPDREVVDPTANVLSLVEAAVKRLDDLRAAETRRIDEQARLVAHYTRLLTEAEAKRIDAIRSVDAAAVGVASERATAQAAVLANQVVASAETLRSLVATTAATVATQLQNLSTQLTDRVSLLEKAQYETKGAKGISVPLLATIAGIVGAILSFIVQRALTGH